MLDYPRKQGYGNDTYKITSANGAAGLPAVFVIASLAAGLPGGAFAAEPALPQREPAVTSTDPIEFFATWFDRVDAAPASQPHWMTAITTVTTAQGRV